MTEDIRISQEEMRSALEDEELPVIYFNGFVASVGTGDVTILLKRHDGHVAILHTPHAVAKTLARHLGSTIATFEQVTDSTILTTDELKAKIEEKINGSSSD